MKSLGQQPETTYVGGLYPVFSLIPVSNVSAGLCWAQTWQPVNWKNERP